MEKIYREATQVLVWLGKNYENSDLAMSWIQSQSSLPTQFNVVHGLTLFNGTSLCFA
jgi:hypothetical protein